MEKVFKKAPHFELTRQQNDFCKRMAGIDKPYPNFGGGKAVDEYLVNLLLDALDKEMSKK